MSKRDKKRAEPPAQPVSPAQPWPTPAKLLAAALLSAWAAQAVGFIRAAAATYDEPVHLASGYSYWATGRYRLNIMDHPPLAEMWAAVPLIVLRPSLLSGHPAWGRLYHYADRFLYENRVGHELLLRSARLFAFFTAAALLAWALAAWGQRLAGPQGALGALAAAAFSPVLGSNLALVTTDGLSAALFFCVFWLLSVERLTPARWAAAGACAGLALGAKFNMILLGPLGAAALLVDHGLRSAQARREGGRAVLPWRGVLLALACAAAALALVYRIFQLPLYWEGLGETLKRLDQGRSAFLMGEHGTQGFWLYFPVALALKTPLAVLGLAAAALVWSARDWLAEGSLAQARRALWVILPAAGYFAASMTAKVQIGVRHLLPMLPFLALLAGWAGARLWRTGTRGRAAAGVLALWAAGSALRAHPHALAYFNELAGGPARGHEWLVDSNLDWGQDLAGLGAALRELGSPPVYLSYFGTADPAAYGIRYLPVAMCCNVTRTGDPVDPAASGRVLFAVSATNRRAVYFRDKELFAWLEGREPLRVLGHSIFLYDLTGDAEGRARLGALVSQLLSPAAARSLIK